MISVAFIFQHDGNTWGCGAEFGALAQHTFTATARLLRRSFDSFITAAAAPGPAPALADAGGPATP